jgi:hypothetical protein
VSRTFLEGCRKRALKGQTGIEDLELECRVLSETLQRVNSLATLLEREVAAITRQRDAMEDERGLSMWPRPILHPATRNDIVDDFPYIVIRPCGYCNRGFHCSDIAMTSYKHTFHLFCLSEIVRTSNKSLICNELFNLNWWRSWGFRGEDEEIEKQDLIPSLQQLQESIAKSLREGLSLPNSSQTGECITALFFFWLIL